MSNKESWQDRLHRHMGGNVIPPEFCNGFQGVKSNLRLMWTPLNNPVIPSKGGVIQTTVSVESPRGVTMTQVKREVPLVDGELFIATMGFELRHCNFYRMTLHRRWQYLAPPTAVGRYRRSISITFIHRYDGSLTRHKMQMNASGRAPTTTTSMETMSMFIIDTLADWEKGNATRE